MLLEAAWLYELLVIQINSTKDAQLFTFNDIMLSLIHLIYSKCDIISYKVFERVVNVLC